MAPARGSVQLIACVRGCRVCGTAQRTAGRRWPACGARPEFRTDDEQLRNYLAIHCAGEGEGAAKLPWRRAGEEWRPERGRPSCSGQSRQGDGKAVRFHRPIHLSLASGSLGHAISKLMRAFGGDLHAVLSLRSCWPRRDKQSSRVSAEAVHSGRCAPEFLSARPRL